MVTHRPTWRPRRSLGVAAGLIACTALATACGASSSPPNGHHASGSNPNAHAQAVNAGLRAKLPASIRQSNQLTVATSADYPPYESIGSDGTTIVGLDPDLGRAIGNVLGLNVKFTNASFDGLVPGLASGKYTAVMAGMQDKKNREQVVSFVDYMTSGSELAVAQGNPQHIRSFTSLCGKSVAVEKGTTQVTFAGSQSAQCTRSGKHAIGVRVFDNENDANLALSSGRVAAVFAETGTQAYAVHHAAGRLELVGPVYDKQHVGIAVPKGQTSLADALKGALQQLISNGAYHNILAKWGLASSAISAAAIDQPYS